MQEPVRGNEAVVKPLRRSTCGSEYLRGQVKTPDEFFSVEDVEISPNIRATAVDPVTHDRLLRYNLTRVIEIAREKDIELLFMNYFYFHGYHVNETIFDIANEQRGDYFSGGHPTTRGHGFIADNIIEVLEHNGSDLLVAR